MVEKAPATNTKFVEVRVPDKGGNAPGGDVIVDVLRHIDGLKIHVRGSRENSDYEGFAKKIALEVNIGAKDATLQATAIAPEGQTMMGHLRMKSTATKSGSSGAGCADVPLNEAVPLNAKQAEQIKGLGEMLLAAGASNAQQGIASQIQNIALNIADAAKDASCRPGRRP